MLTSVIITLLIINIYLPYVVLRTTIITKLFLQKCKDYGNICDQKTSIYCCNNYGVCRATGLLNDALDDIHKCLSPAIVGEFCQTDFDCLGSDNAICNSEINQCQCLPNFGVLTIRRSGECVALIDGHCDIHADCLVPNSICVDNKCQCKKKFIKKSLRECIESTVGQKCRGDLDCNDILHIGCSVDKKCVCKGNHILINNSTCVPLLDEFCWSDERCAVDNSICFENKCRCKSDYMAIANTHCIEWKLFVPCKRDEECSNVPNSVCSIYGRCICNHNYLAVGTDECRGLPNLEIQGKKIL